MLLPPFTRNHQWQGTPDRSQYGPLAADFPSTRQQHSFRSPTGCALLEVRLPPVNAVYDPLTERSRPISNHLPPLAHPSTYDAPISRRLPALPSLADEIRDHRPLTRSRSNSLRRAASTSTVPISSSTFGQKQGYPYDSGRRSGSGHSFALTPGPPSAVSEAGYSPPHLPAEQHCRHSSQWERARAASGESSRSFYGYDAQPQPPAVQHHAANYYQKQQAPSYNASPHHRLNPNSHDPKSPGEGHAGSHASSPPGRPCATPNNGLPGRFFPMSGHAASLPPLSNLTYSLSTPSTPPTAQSALGMAGVQPNLHLVGSRKRGRGWEDMTAEERQESIQRLLHNYTSRLVVAMATCSDQRHMAKALEGIVDSYFVTVTCSHSGVAQKSYGHEKRFLCPPPIVRVRGPGYTMPSATPDVARLLRVSILPGISESGLVMDGGSPSIISEEITLDRTLQAKFGHLHVGGSTSSAKTFRLRFDMLKNTSPPVTHETSHNENVAVNGANESFKSPRISDGFYGGRAHHPTAFAVAQPWLTRDSEAISVISKPSKKTTKAKTSSSQITPDLAICLFNRVNSQNVRTKYMAVDDGHLSARNDSWTTFHMRPVGAAHPGSTPSCDAVTYGSIVVLEATGQGTVSDPMVVCKVEKGNIIIPLAFENPAGGPNGIGAAHRREDTGSSFDISGRMRHESVTEGPISQMQKVAFMRYESPPYENSHPGAFSSVQGASSRRRFLCSAPPEPWWQSHGSSADPQLLPSRNKPLTAPMRMSSRLNGHSRSEDSRQSNCRLYQSTRSQSSSPDALAVRQGLPITTFPQSLPSHNNDGASEPLAPTPLTFMPAGRAADSFGGSVPGSASTAVKEADVANDAFCWSVVGASHFEFSFSKVGLPVDGAFESPPADGVVGNVPAMSEKPRIFHESQILRLALDPTKSMSPSEPWQVWQVWLGGMGPLPCVDGNGSYLDLRLPTLDTLLHYCRSIYDDSAIQDAGADIDQCLAMSHVKSSEKQAPHRSSPRFEAQQGASLSSSSQSSSRRVDHGLPTSLPIILVKDFDGTLCKTSYCLELFRAADHHSLAIRIIAIV